MPPNTYQPTDFDCLRTQSDHVHLKLGLPLQLIVLHESRYPWAKVEGFAARASRPRAQVGLALLFNFENRSSKA